MQSLRSARAAAGPRPFVASGTVAPRTGRLAQPRHVCEAASIQFIRGVDEPTVPDVSLRRARTGTSGQATFVFENPSIFQASSELGDITGLFMVDEEGTLSTTDVKAKFVNGKPQAIEARYSMRSQFEWDRFIRFMDRYAEANGMGFEKSAPQKVDPGGTHTSAGAEAMDRKTLGCGAVLGVAVCGATAAAAYGYDQFTKRYPVYKHQCELFREYEEAMMPPRERMEELEDDIVKQMQLGMDKAGASNILMLPTYVLKLPTGDERGACYAIDIGGTNFRVVYYKLSDKRGVIEEQVMKQVAIPKEVYTGTSTQLFDFLALQLADFIKEQEARHKVDAATAPAPVVGFCFSFAVEQQALDSGKLMCWTKGFNVDGVVGKDVVALLSDALTRAGKPCRVLALINDSVGVLTASCYFDHATEMGVILGTGTNACIVDKVSKMPKWRPKGVPGETRTAINTEWGCYGSALLPRVKEDLELDAASGPQQGRMLVEKLMSGLYMGDCARRLLLSFAQRADLFGGDIPNNLTVKDSFTTADMCEIESDTTLGRSRVASVLQQTLGLYPDHVNLETRYMIQAICRLVTRRSARVAAGLLVAVLRLQGWLDAPRRLVVAVDGGVFLKYANWRTFLDTYLREAFGARAKELVRLIQFKPTADGSSFGAAVLAAAAASS
ncbi:HXK1 [Scenedesmus sp. PABB004]|nr:HXK1 [Scenedesmus sp. PABB004]